MHDVSGNNLIIKPLLFNGFAANGIGCRCILFIMYVYWVGSLKRVLLQWGIVSFKRV